MRIFGERQPGIALAALAFVVLNNVVASFGFLAIYGFDLRAFGDPAGLIERGPDAADFLRLAALVDMVGYLAFAPVVVHFHRRLGAARPELGSVALLTLCGLAFVLVGSIGAVLLASAGPALLHTSAESPGSTTAARVAFTAVANAVLVGLWGTLELTLYGSWLIGVAWLVRLEGRAFAALGIVAGSGALAYALRTGLTGSIPGPLSSPVDALILGAVGVAIAWIFWLVVRLWQGR